MRVGGSFVVNPLKPKKTATDLITELKNKGVNFLLVSENDAMTYLRKNNYLRTSSYRRNFGKNQKGNNTGKYYDLDFGYLMELASIDQELRSILLNMCIDIEHAIKSQLLYTIENNPAEDGYHIVDEFLIKYPRVGKDIEKKSNAIFTERLIHKYFVFNGNNILYSICPIWVLVELITFGDLLNLVYLYNQLYPLKPCSIPTYNEISPVKSLRNACAHDNCLLNDMRQTTTTRPTGAIVGFVQKMGLFSSTQIRKKLSCRPTFEIVSLIYFYDRIVLEDTRSSELKKLNDFVHNRMHLHIDYFKNNKIITSTFEFFGKVLDFIT